MEIDFPEENDFQLEEEEFEVTGYRGGNVGSIWLLIHALQYVCFLTMLELDLPDHLKTFMKSLFRYDVIPNVFEMFFDSDLTDEVPFEKAVDFGIDTPIFFLNSG